METISYSDLLKRVVSYSQRTYDELTNDDSDLIKSYLDNRLKQIWEFYSWPDLVRIEKRYYRGIYASATTYQAGTEVYYPAENKYYQALKQTQGNVPTLTTHWAESKQSYSAELWAAGASYVVGDIVEYASDGLFYACHTAHTSSGTLIPTATGNNARWGKLTELDQYVAWKQTGENQIGDVIDVWTDNYHVNNKAERVKYLQSNNGVQVVNGEDVVYIEYRQRVPNVYYSVWATGNDYAVDDVVRFPATGAAFNLYRATTAHTPTTSNEPTDNTSPWALIEIPRDFRAFLSHGAAADLLMNDEKEQLAGVQQAMSDKALAELLDKLERQEKQSKQMCVIH